MNQMTFKEENGYIVCYINGKEVSRAKKASAGASTQDVIDIINDQIKANPDLSGTEPNLEGLEVSGDKYAVPQGGGGIEYVELNSASGTIEVETFQKLDFGGAYIKYNDIVLIPNGREQSGGGLGGTKTCYFDSTVNNNKYLSCVLTASLPLPPNATVPYTITEISVGGGSELDAPITIDSTNFEAYDTYFGTSIGAGLYRLGIIFKNKTTNERYCIVCNTETDPDSIDWEDPDIFNICMGFVRGGDLVLKEDGSWFTKMGVVCQYTTSSSTDTKIQMLK